MQSKVVEREQALTKECREKWFSKHQIVVDAPNGYAARRITDLAGAPWVVSALPKMVIFKEPDTLVYSVKLVLSGGTLFVDGDIGSAAYRWNEVIGWESFLGFSLDYFAGKCTASEQGWQYNTWDSEIARSYLEDKLKEMDAELVEMGEEARYKAYWNELKNGYVGGSIEDADAWHAAIHSGDIDSSRIGDDDNEWLWDIGTVLDARCIGHWVACRMVGEHMQAKRKENEIPFS